MGDNLKRDVSKVVDIQIQLQHEMQRNGLNLVTCCNCGSTMIHKKDDEVMECFCGIVDLSDCEDYWYNGMENNIEFR